jgi:hypothetical protein
MSVSDERGRHRLRSPRLLSAGDLSVPKSVAGIGNFFSLPRYPSGTRSRDAYNQ